MPSQLEEETRYRPRTQICIYTRSNNVHIYEIMMLNGEQLKTTRDRPTTNANLLAPCRNKRRPCTIFADSDSDVVSA